MFPSLILDFHKNMSRRAHAFFRSVRTIKRSNQLMLFQYYLEISNVSSCCLNIPSVFIPNVLLFAIQRQSVFYRISFLFLLAQVVHLHLSVPNCNVFRVPMREEKSWKNLVYSTVRSNRQIWNEKCFYIYIL